MEKFSIDQTKGVSFLCTICDIKPGVYREGTSETKPQWSLLYHPNLGLSAVSLASFLGVFLMQGDCVQ